MNQTAELLSENHELREKLVHRDQEIHLLKEMVRSLTHRQFGTSSEKSPDQQPLFDEAEKDAVTDNDESDLDDNEAVTIPAYQRKKQKRVSIPDWIEREEIIHDLPESEKVCPHDGSTLKCIGEETHEQLDIIPAQIKALRHIRKKYACPSCEGYLITAPKPKQPIEKVLHRRDPQGSKSGLSSGGNEVSP